MYSVVALKFGYAEDSSAAWLVLCIDHKFPTKLAALQSLAGALYNKFEETKKEELDYTNKYKKHMARCCQKAWNKKESLARCPTCDAKYDIEQKLEFNIDEWKDYLHKLLYADGDSWGEEYYWDPWSFDFKTPPDEIVVVNLYADDILTMALLSVNPELIGNEKYIVHEYKKDLYANIIKE